MNKANIEPSANDLFEITASKVDINRVLSSGPDACYKLGKLAIDLGHLSLAYDILKAGIEKYPGHIGITYLAALSLARSGSLDEAEAILSTILVDIVGESRQSIDVLSLAGRISKDRWAQAQTEKISKAAGEKSIRSYLQAYQLTRDYFPGVNAATMMRLMGKNSTSKELAGQIKDICLAIEDPDHWCLATLGEVSLLTGDMRNARKWYRKASQLAKGKYGDLASMRRQLNLIRNYMDFPSNILRAVTIPSVAAFVQSPLSNTGSAYPAIENKNYKAFSQSLLDKFSTHEIGFSYSSVLCKEEIIFVEEMQRLGKETSVHLPFDHKEYFDLNSGAEADKWLTRIQAVITKADRTEITTDEGHFGDDSLYDYTTRLIGGYALLRAKHLETNLVLFTVSGEGGIENDPSFALLKEQARQVEIVNPLLSSKIIPASKANELNNAQLYEIKVPTPRAIRKVRTMIFADVVGFSRLTEENTQAYVGFLDEIAEILQKIRRKPLFKNTWGDGLFLVFENAIEAAGFALELLEKFINTNWEKKRLPSNTNIRIGMHTGPVYPAVDRIIGQENFFGTHVNKAARIEPIAMPGTIYLTEQCAAYIESEDKYQFTLDYLGPLPLAKGFGSYRIYRLRRRSTIEGQFT